jgi:hypothetical protein
MMATAPATPTTTAPDRKRALLVMTTIRVQSMIQSKAIAHASEHLPMPTTMAPATRMISALVLRQEMRVMTMMLAQSMM